MIGEFKMRMLKNLKAAYALLLLLLLVSQPAFSAETKDEITVDTVIDKMVEKAAGIRTIKAELSSTNATMRKTNRVTFYFKQPGLFRMDIPDGPVQPRVITIMNEQEVKGWMPDQDLLSNNPHREVLHPGFIFTFCPERIRFYAGSLKLEDPEKDDQDYVINMALKENHHLNHFIYSRVIIHVSKKDYIITKIQVINVHKRYSVAEPVGYHDVEGIGRVPVAWRHTFPDDLYFDEFSLIDIKINIDILDKVFELDIPENAIVIVEGPMSKKEFEEALEKNPKDQDMLYSFGLYLAGGGNHTEAREQFEKLVELRPDSPTVKLMLATALAATRESEKAVSLCDEVLKSPSISAAMRLQIADIYDLVRQKEKALEQYEKVIDLYPEDPTGYEKVVSSLRKNPEEARKFIRRYLKTAGDDIGAKFIALGLSSMFEELDPLKKMAVPILQDEEANSWILNQLARLFWSKKDYAITIEAYEKLVDMEPEFLPAYIKLNDVYTRIQQTDKQVDLADKLVQLKSGNPAIIGAAASIYAGAEKFDEAIKTLEGSLGVIPFTQEMYYDLSGLYGKVGREKDIEKILKSLMAECPDEGKTHFIAGAIYEDMEDIGKAREKYQTAVSYGDIDGPQYIKILKFYVLNDLSSDAELVADQIIDTSRDSELVFVAADALQQIGNIDKALSAISAAVTRTMNPNDQWKYRFFQAQLYLLKGEKDKALPVLKDLVKRGYFAPEKEMRKDAQLLYSNLVQELELTGEDREEYVAQLIARMKQSDLREQDIEDIKIGLIKYGEDARDKLVELLISDKFDTRRLAIEILGEVGGPSTALVIRKSLNDVNPRIVLETVIALGKLKDLESYDNIVTILKGHPEGAIRAAAAGALGNIGDIRAVDPLLESLKSEPNKQILLEVTQALAALGDRKAVEPLRESLKNEKGMTVKTWIAEALALFGEDEGYDFLVEVLSTGIEVEVKHAMLAVIHIPGERSFEILKKSFKDIRPLVRKYAAMGAHQRVGEDVIPLLAEALDDDDGSVRYAAVISIGNYGKKEGIAPLEKRLEKEKDDEILQMINDALEALKSLN